MAEYIDKDELLSYLYNLQDEPHDIAIEIAQFPAADAAPVVRCKDCTYYHPALCALPDGSGANWGVCEKLLDSDTEDNIQTSDEGFCWFAMKAGEACD